MYNVRKIQDDIYWLGASDRRLEKFENTYSVPSGMSYNNYLILLGAIPAALLAVLFDFIFI